MGKRVTALFAAKTEAERAIEALTARGIRREDISILSRQDMGEERHENEHEGMTSGGVIGAATGLMMGLSAFAVPGLGLLAAAGPIASLLAGAAAGGLLGSLADIGLSNSVMQGYVKEIERGSTLLSVDVQENQQIVALLRELGAYQIDAI